MRSAFAFELLPRTILLCFLAATLALLAGCPTALGQGSGCTCPFDTQTYQAHATIAGCGIYMSYQTGNHICEISVNGAGANSNLMLQSLGKEALEKQYIYAASIFQQSMQFERTGDRGLFLSPGFIFLSLVTLERGTVFRQASLGQDLDLKQIDAEFMDLVHKNIEQIAGVFNGKAQTFTDKNAQGSTLAVTQGSVEFTLQRGGKVRITLFSQPKE